MVKGDRWRWFESIDFRVGDDFGVEDGLSHYCVLGRTVSTSVTERAQRRATHRFNHLPAIERLYLSRTECTAVDPNVVDFALQ